MKSTFIVLFRLGALLCVAALAYLGQTALLAGDLGQGTICFGIAGLTVVTVFRPATELCYSSWPVPPAPSSEPPFGKMRAFLVLTFITISLLLFFRSDFTPGTAWITYVLALLVLGFGDCIVSPLKFPRAVIKFIRDEPDTTLFLCLITAASFFVRLYKLSDYPPGLWFDESNIGLMANRILELPSYKPVFIGDGLEQPGLHFLLVAASMYLFGPTAFALRIPTAFGSALAVIPLYFLVSQLFRKKHIAVLATTLLCFSAWHINFSRWGVNVALSNLLDLLSITFLVYGFRKNERAYFIKAGLCLGIGLNFYHASRTFALFICVASGLWFLKSKFSGRQFVNLSAAALATLITISPLVEFAIQNPDTFFKHTTELNIFKTTTPDQTESALIGNTKLHLLMFNYSGDAMIRHNAPGEAILEPVTGTAFALGAAVAIFYLARFEFVLLVAGFICALLGGILSKPVDLPTSLRTIDCSIFVFTMAAAAVSMAIAAVNSLIPSKLLKGGLVWSVVAAFGIISSINSLDKFYRHMHLDETWVNFNGPYKKIAEHIIRTDLRRSAVYLPEVYLGQPTLLFYLPEAQGYKPFNDNLLPFEDASQDYFVCRDQFDSTTKLEAFYPTAKKVVITPPFDSSYKHATCFDIKKKDVEESLGVTMEVFNNREFSGEPARSVSPEFALDSGEPRSSDIGVTQTGAIKIDEAGYLSLQLVTSAETTVLFQNDKVLSAAGEYEVYVPAGTFVIKTHTIVPAGVAAKYQLKIRLQSAQRDREGTFTLFRSPPVVSGGLFGQYFNGMLWENAPQLMRVDPTINFYFHLHPVPQPNSILWQGDLSVPEEGDYRFHTSAVDFVQVYLDGKLIMFDKSPLVDPVDSPMIHLTKGKHEMVVAYASQSGYAGVTLTWDTTEGNGFIPWNSLLPRDLHPDLDRIRKDAIAIRAGMTP